MENKFFTSSDWKYLPVIVWKIIDKCGLVPSFNDETYETDCFEGGNYGAHLINMGSYSGQYRDDHTDLYIHWDEKGNWSFRDIRKTRSLKGIVNAIKRYMEYPKGNYVVTKEIYHDSNGRRTWYTIREPEYKIQEIEELVEYSIVFKGSFRNCQKYVTSVSPKRPC